MEYTMENDIACEDFYHDDDETNVIEAISDSGYSDEDLFTFSDKYNPIYEKYQKQE
jgi:hypothetical protein